MNFDFLIRNLNKEDIPQMSKARKEQENENGNGATDEYIENYEKILKKLFEDKKIIAAGAFKENQLVSVACFNLINYGSNKKIPYLCAVWTNPDYRGIGLASKVNNKLTESMLEIREQLQPRTLLTLEGTEAALHLYKKIGYKNVVREMTFLGDVQRVDISNLECTKSMKDIAKKDIVYGLKGNPVMQISYSEEQFFSHPKNLNGKMYRILAIKSLIENASQKTVNLFLQQFFQEHRFCKFNVNELVNNEKNLYKILNVENGNIEGVISVFKKMKFKGINGDILKINESSGIMEKDLSRDFSEADKKDSILKCK